MFFLVSYLRGDTHRQMLQIREDMEELSERM